MEDNLPDDQLQRFSDFIAETMGLHFPPARWADLRRGLTAVAGELNFDDAAACVRWLTSVPLDRKQLETLASNLTVGETYFFRDNPSLSVFSDHILPELVRERKNGERRLRIWSAACCTGEEPYSIAILLKQAIADLDNWNITILATDINPHFLRKAAAGVYGPWSFRQTPPWIQQRYFRKISERCFEIVPEIKRMVRYAHLNLADDIYPSLANDTNAMDVIFCRNVLMYFTPAHAAKVIQKLGRAQVDGGWLIVGPCESPQLSAPPYFGRSFPNATVYRKENRVIPVPISRETPMAALVPNEPQRPRGALPEAISKLTQSASQEARGLYQQGRYAEAIEKLRNLLASGQEDSTALSLLARSLANQGRLDEALDYCNRWIAVDKLNAVGHYLRAIILQEQGSTDEAVRSLRAALYLDSGLVLAHFALGNIARDRGELREADRHLENAARSSSRYRADEVLPESDGLTAGRFAEIVGSLRL